jgi:hypothetical protein
VNTLALSLIRTYAPILVGAFASWLLTVGLDIDSETQAGLVIFLTGLLQAVYYTVVRLAEQRFPGIGVLLGAAKSPDAYSKGEEPAAVEADADVDVSDDVELPPLDAPGPDHRA